MIRLYKSDLSPFLLSAEAGLIDGLRLVRELSYINNISVFTGGEVPMEVLLRNILGQVLDSQRASYLKDALLELESNAPSQHAGRDIRAKSTKTRSHARFDSFTDAVKKREFQDGASVRETTQPTETASVMVNNCSDLFFELLP